MLNTVQEEKLAQLEELLKSYGSVALGYSGGVDSTFLAAVLARCMPERALLVHLATAFVGTPEKASYEREVARFGLPVLELDTAPLEDPRIAANPHDRCYWCKRSGFLRIVEEARARGYATVIEGSNADDPEDSRPGMRAMRELGVRAPLRDAGWTKDEERAVLRAWGIETWSMPADACLPTRIPCGEHLTLQKLETVRACEDYLHELGLALVRVRLVDGEARVQAAPEDLARLATMSAGETDVQTTKEAVRESPEPAGRSSDITQDANRDERPAGNPYDCAPAAATASEPVPTPESAPIPNFVIEAFHGFGARTVAPMATPYRYGSMNAAQKDT